jgi:hypothetical protein
VNDMITPEPEKIMYCYGEYQPMFDEFPHVTFAEGLPDITQFDGQHRTLLILDDLMNKNSDAVSELFTRVSHHRNVSVYYISQNIFQKSKHSRTISLNAHYIIMFKNPRDANQIATLSRQMYPSRGNF